MFDRADPPLQSVAYSPVGDVLDAIPAAIVLTDSMGRIQSANDGFVDLFQINRSDLIGAAMEDLVPAAQRADCIALFRRFREPFSAETKCLHGEFLGLRGDSQVFPIELSLKPLWHGGETRILVTVRDATPRYENKRNLESVFQAAPFGMVLVNSSGRITRVNPELTRLFGYELEDLLGQPIEILVPTRSREHHGAMRAEYVKSPKSRRMGEGRDLTGRRKDGTEFPIEIGLSAIESDAGRQSLATVIDISHRIQAEMALRLANTNLEEFTYVASHDLKSPLRAIADLLSWIKESIEAGDTSAALRNIERARTRAGILERIVEDLLTFALAGRVYTDHVEFSVRDLIRNVLAVLDVPPTFTISVHCPNLSIVAPKTPLETGLRNLVANAVKHRARDDGRVEISVAERDAFIVFSVKDDGPGVHKSARSRIFKMFQTAAAKGKSGSGIGLAISKRMVEGHGGEIELLDTSDDAGCTFQLSWPRFVRRPDAAA